MLLWPQSPKPVSQTHLSPPSTQPKPQSPTHHHQMSEAAGAASAAVGTSILDESIAEEMVDQKSKPDWANIATIKRLVTEVGLLPGDGKVPAVVLHLFASA